jgi:hypothetical protein
MTRIARTTWARLGRLLSLALVALAIGCAASNQSLLEKGDRVDSGRRDFDQYFEEVAELRDDVKKLDDKQLFLMREPLIESMEIDPEINLATLLDETRRRVGKLRDFGITLDLLLTPQPKMVIDRGEMNSEDDKGLPQAIQESAERAMTFFKQHQELLERVAVLESKRAEAAERLDKLPTEYEKREMLETEIVGAGRVLGGVREQLLDNTQGIAHFLVGLSTVSDTGARTAYDDRCERAIAVYDEQEQKKQQRASWQKRHGSRAARPAPAPQARPQARPRPAPAPRPAPPPTTRPAVGGDFEM